MNKYVRGWCCLVYLICVGSVLRNAESNRQILVFLVSFTFQTNTVMAVSMATRTALPRRWQAVLQRLGVVWSVYMAFIWYYFLFQPGEDRTMRVFNEVLPFMFWLDWITDRERLGWERDRFLYLPTFLSVGFIYCVGKFHLGYQIYPLFDAYEKMFVFDWKRENLILLFLQIFWTEIMAVLSFNIVLLFVLIDWGTAALNRRWVRREVHTD